ncbi:B3 domain-containing protein REM8-like isoform X2 [Macadamia integrifolia]|uniref:B3 domain-containing protein REM8-like isoform X2 n=1 Tax=Macadamia integrifolia TaxID=60698 RepID=UPI001C4E74E6|nr:B3 domain-containing protein REM8-like isoform X2 [Macadamia integrifolia]
MANLGIRHWTEPQFFKPILPPFQRLSIPKAFLKHLVDEMCEEGVGEATLRNHQCAQKSWRVKVKGFCFTKGWNDFFRDNDLGLGDFLVFTYKGSMVFDVKIFDRSCCEKKYHYPPATPVKMETHKHPPATLVKMETQKHQERDHNQSGDKEIKINNLSNGRFRTLPCNGSKVAQDSFLRFYCGDSSALREIDWFDGEKLHNNSERWKWKIMGGGVEIQQ